LQLNVFDQPVKKHFFNNLLEVLSFFLQAFHFFLEPVAHDVRHQA
jgi:hypothetical protein